MCIVIKLYDKGGKLENLWNKKSPKSTKQTKPRAVASAAPHPTTQAYGEY